MISSIHLLDTTWTTSLMGQSRYTANFVCIWDSVCGFFSTQGTSQLKLSWFITLMVPLTSNLDSTLVTFNYRFMCLNSSIVNLDMGVKRKGDDYLWEVATCMLSDVTDYNWSEWWRFCTSARWTDGMTSARHMEIVLKINSYVWKGALLTKRSILSKNILLLNSPKF
jgi:hypothetical protein